jgi:hypothetical protein
MQKLRDIASFAPRRRWPVLALALNAALALVGLPDAQVVTPAASATSPNAAVATPPVATASAATPPPVVARAADQKPPVAAPDFHYASDAPKEAEAKIREWANSRGREMLNGHQLIKDPDNPKTLPPIATYQMPRNQAIDNAGLEAAVSSGGFEYFVVQASPIYVDFGIDKSGSFGASYGYVETLMADATTNSGARIVSALESLRAEKSINPSDYEVRMLIFPSGAPFVNGAYYGARVLWLKSLLRGGKDLLWPIGVKGWPKRAAADRLCAPDELFNALWPEREKAIAADGVPVALAQPRAVAVAALAVIAPVLADTGYVGPNNAGGHQGLYNDLTSLQRAAEAVAKDDGSSPADSTRLNYALARALDTAITRTNAIANRATETDASRQRNAEMNAAFQKMKSQ